MTRDEVKSVLNHLADDKWLIALLMLDFSCNKIIVRDGKGVQDQISMLPVSPKTPLHEHLGKVYQKDLSEGYGCVQMPYAIERKYLNAAANWRWQWVFPQERS